MTKTYEGMFLLDAGNPDFEAAAAPVRQVLDRAQAEVLSLKPWDDRRLAYDIKGRKRGLYVLAYFKAEPARIAEMEHELQLSENVLRAMLLSADHLSEEQIRAETPATLAASRRASAEASRAHKAQAEQARESQESKPAESASAEGPARERRRRPPAAPARRRAAEDEAAGDQPESSAQDSRED